jgi:signal transduction histidine kinase
MATLGLLAPSMAHEIKNPLHFINSFAELSSELAAEVSQEVSEDAAPLVRDLLLDLTLSIAKVREHGARAEAVVRGMLEQSRGRPGETRRVDLNALVRAYTQAARRDHATRVEVRLDEAVGALAVVPEEIGRVVLNLVTNALYAAEAQGGDRAPEVTVSTVAREDHIEVRVRDNGAGIPAHLNDRIYAPFFTTKPAGEGTGLGLSISRDIVRGHGGAITFNTVEGDHTEFVVTLPRSG